MGEEDARKKGQQAGAMEKVLRERERLDQMIEEAFRKKRTILFSDVCGFTQYMDKMGDIRGRAWIQKHHDIVLPLIEANEGKVLDIMGDGVMASFADSRAAVRAAVSIQEGLDAYNLKASPIDCIHVKIGINTGEILEDGDSIAGDVVNVASRIESQAMADQILVSKQVYDEVCGDDDILCRYNGTVSVKGKPTPLELYRVVWKDEDVIISLEPTVRSSNGSPAPAYQPVVRELSIDVTCEGDNLRVGALEQVAGEASTVRHYESIPVSMDQIGSRCRGIIETLNKANRQGRVTRDILTKLRDSGQILTDDLFPQKVKDALRESKAGHLIINQDDQLVQVPWELLHDGRQFLCQRFSMGRLVRTKQSSIGSGKTRALARPLKMLILADPRGDLKWAYHEGTEIRDSIDNINNLIHAALRTDNITVDYVREKIRNFDLVHFAGHYDYDQNNPWKSCWRLTDGGLKAEDISKMAGTGALPALIFSNACQSARADEWALSESIQDEIFGLANAFILAGVKHYVGTFWEVLDEPSRRFALAFYDQLLKGVTIGDAVRKARLTVIDEYGEETIVWASYLLYGDPGFNYLDQIRQMETPEEIPESSHIPLPETDTRAREDVIDFGAQETPQKKAVWIAGTAAVLIFIAILLFGYPGILLEKTAKYETTALSAFNAGDYQAALDASRIIQDKDADIRLGYLIPGDIYFRQGKIDAARQSFEQALDASKGTDIQKSRALMGLGRIASLQKQNEKALAFYQKAAELAPEDSSGYMAQALLMDKMGRSGQALTMIAKAANLAPGDRIIESINAEISRKVSLTRDQKKRERIDALIKELLDTQNQQPRSEPWDGWTSRPMTIWVMDLSTQGYSLQEGEERLLASGITDQLLQTGRIQVVERELLDALMEELRLGTSNLADRRTALNLGKILAARFMLTGRIIYGESDNQVSLRLIETETGRIIAAVSETVGSAVPVSATSEKLAKNILNKINKMYPLRAKVTGSQNKSVRLNIGTRAGVAAGSRFKVVDEEAFLEVVSAEADASSARIVSGEAAITRGMRVEKE